MRGGYSAKLLSIMLLGCLGMVHLPALAELQKGVGQSSENGSVEFGVSQAVGKKDTLGDLAKDRSKVTETRQSPLEFTDAELSRDQIPVKCRNSAGEVLGQKNCSSLRADVRALVVERLNKEVTEYYAGRRIKDWKTFETEGYPKPVCNVTKDEISTNKNGESCGQTVRFSVSWDGDVSVNSRKPRGTAERAYYAGAEIQAYKRATYDKLVEFDAGNIRLTTMSGDKPCSVHAAATSFMQDKFESHVEEYVGIAGGEAAASKLKCESDEAVGRGVASNVVCRNADSYRRIVAQWAYLIRCEALAKRMDTFYNQVGTFENISAKAREKLEPICKGPYLDCGLICSGGDYEDAINRCYPIEFPKFLKEIMQPFDTRQFEGAGV